MVAERVVRTVSHGRELPEGFSRRQRRLGPGLLFTVHRPGGGIDYSFRPNTPDEPGRKYEQRSKRCGGPGNVLDVHPSLRRLVGDTSVPLIYVEGVKKADAITTAARAAGARVLVVAVSGVWNFLSEGEPVPDLLEIPVEGREVGIVFDSDVLTNPGVQGAAVRLAETEISRGATVKLAFLPDAPDGSKVGADDFLVSGKSYAELRMTMRSYNPGDFELVKLSRDDELRAMLRDLKRRHEDTLWTWPGAERDSNLYQALAGAARRHGKVHADGIRVVSPWGTLGPEARIASSRTVGKCIARLEERGMLYRDNEGRKQGRPGAFVLIASAASGCAPAPRAGVKQVGGGHAGEEKATEVLQRWHPSTLHPRSPRLWASRPRLKPTRQMIHEHRLGTRSYLPAPQEAIKRLGKRRSHAFDRLDAAGGSLDREELAELLGVRPRDLTRRKTSPKGRDGLLVWPIEAGIVAYRDGVFSLTEDWLDRLEDEREKGGENEADEWAERRRRRRSAAYREHLAEVRRGRPAASKPSAAGLAAVGRSHRRRAEQIAEHEKRRAEADAAGAELKRLAKRVVHDRLRALGRIRLELLRDVLRDAGADPAHALPAAKSLGCTVERLPEYEDREFVFAPREWAA